MLAVVWRTMIWFVAGTAVALGFLLVPLEVAAQRKQLDHTVGDIAQAERDIRALQTEFDTRANYAQVERWNGDQLAMNAPVAQQFVHSEAALASLDVQDAGAAAQVQTASFVPSGPPATEAVTRVISREALAAEAARRPASAPAPAPAVVRTAQLARVAAPAPREPARPHLQAVAMVDRDLLSAATLRDLSSGARSEADHLR